MGTASVGRLLQFRGPQQARLPLRHLEKGACTAQVMLALPSGSPLASSSTPCPPQSVALVPPQAGLAGCSALALLLLPPSAGLFFDVMLNQPNLGLLPSDLGLSAFLEPDLLLLSAAAARCILYCLFS